MAEGCDRTHLLACLAYGKMRGFIDLHSHWVAGVDDGARSIDDSRALLVALHAAGFDTVVATPHMRPGMFDNQKRDLVEAYARTHAAVAGTPSLPPHLSLASEHFFDDVVFDRLLAGDALPYPGGHAVLIELNPSRFPAMIAHRLHDLVRRGIRPVIAHPERYEPVWRDAKVLDPMLDVGAVLLLDVAALVDKYGRAATKAAKHLLAEGYYFAACSDAHKASDVDDVRAGIDALHALAGAEEAAFLLREGPQRILAGTVKES